MGMPIHTAAMAKPIVRCTTPHRMEVMATPASSGKNATGKDQKADHDCDSQPDLWAEGEDGLINHFHGTHYTRGGSGMTNVVRSVAGTELLAAHRRHANFKSHCSVA